MANPTTTEVHDDPSRREAETKSAPKTADRVGREATPEERTQQLRDGADSKARKAAEDRRERLRKDTEAKAEEGEGNRARARALALAQLGDDVEEHELNLRITDILLNYGGHVPEMSEDQLQAQRDANRQIDGSDPSAEAGGGGSQELTNAGELADADRAANRAAAGRLVPGQ